MYPGSNNYNNQYPNYNQQPQGGNAPVGFNVGQPGFNPSQGGQPGSYNQQYVPGVPYNPGQTYPGSQAQGQYYPQQPSNIQNPGSAWNQNPPGMYGGSNPPMGQPQTNPNYGCTYPPMGQAQNVPSYGCTNPPMGQPQNVPGYGGTNPPMGQPQNVPGYGGTNPPMGGNPQINPNCGYTNPPMGQQPLPSEGMSGGHGIGSGGEGHKGTIKPHPNFNAEHDCEILRKAMKGIGTDEKAITECLGRRNLDQRLAIKKTYKTMFGKDLIEELKSELSSNFSRAVVESLYDSDYFDAYSLHKAMEGAGTREDVLTEILTSRTNEEIENIKAIYKKSFNKDLEKDVVSETSGFYKRILVSCLQANKKELTEQDYHNLKQNGPSAVVDMALANKEANELYNAGEKKLGTDEAIFIKIFATRNKYQLRATFSAYEKLSGHNILKAIESEMGGDLASALKAIALQNMNEPLYFANRLYNSMKGAGTNDTALIRIILSRSEIDLANIKQQFQKQYNQTLEAFVKGDTSGDYQNFLMRFLEGN